MPSLTSPRWPPPSHPPPPAPSPKVSPTDAESWETLQAIPTGPSAAFTDDAGVTTRWLLANATVPFTLELERNKGPVLEAFSSEGAHAPTF